MVKQNYDLDIAVYRYLYRCLVENDEEELCRAGLSRSHYYILESEKFFVGSAKYRQSPAVTASAAINWQAVATQPEPNASSPLPLRSLRLRTFVLETAQVYQQLLSQFQYKQLYAHGAKYEDMKYILEVLPHNIRPSTKDVRIRLRYSPTRCLRLRQTTKESLDTAVKILEVVRNHGTGQMVSELFGIDQHDYRYARKICQRHRRGRHQPLSMEQQQKIEQVLMQTCYVSDSTGESFRMPSLRDYLRIYAAEPNTPFWAIHAAASKLYDHHKQMSNGKTSRPI